MLFLRAIFNNIRIDENQPELNRERFAALLKQIPIMYGILVVNMVTLVVPHIGHAPDYLTIYLPLILCILFIVRIVNYVQSSLDDLSDEAIAKRLNSTIILSIVLSVFFITWALALFSYASDLMLAHIIFFLYITLFCCAFCLLHIMQSAIYLTLVIIVPSFIYLIMQDQLIFKSMAINSLVVSAGIIYLLTNHYTNFTNLVRQKQKLTKQSEKLKQLSQKNMHLANLDSLTELPNRRSFFSQLEKLTEIYKKSPDSKFIVGLLDLDGFKRINDIFGHPTGDDLLIKSSERIKDVVGDNISLSRLGGDEFGLIITCPKDMGIITEMGHMLCEAMQIPFDLRDGRVQIAATIGFVEFPTMADTPQLLFERADYALCYSKQHSKGMPVVFSHEHETIIREISNIEQQLHDANLNEELSIMFQPIVDTHNNRTVGFEALARWHNPVLGFVRPDIFIRSAEQMGTVSKLTVILLKKALKLACQWPDDLYMSFNLSIYDLSSHETILNLVHIIENSDFPNERIVFEVTETAVMHNFDKTLDALKILKAQGAKIALDDFGTGYSSLSYVQRMPLDRLKIDRSFIMEIDTDKDTSNIVRTIIDLCNNLDLYCIVEGVETEDQLHALAEVGGRYVQGYYFSKPLSQADAMAFLDKDLDIALKA